MSRLATLPSRYRLGPAALEFKATIRKIVEAGWPLAKGQALADRTELPSDDKLWVRLAQSGATALLVPETSGGLGNALLEMVLAIEECGRRLVPDSLLVSGLIATSLLAEGPAELAGPHLTAMSEGRLRAALVTDPEVRWRPHRDGYRIDGKAASVLEAGKAGLLLIADGGAHVVVALSADRADVEKHAVACFDSSRRYADLHFDDVRVGPDEVILRGAAAVAALEKTRRRAQLGVAADALGGTLGAIELAVEYAKQREQFGRPIGSFQALKHMLADAYVRADLARSVVYHAARVLGSGDAGVEQVLAAAKAMTNDAYLKSAVDAVQIHGGSGFTKEIPAFLFLQRAKTDDAMYGTSREFYREIGRRLSAGEPTGW